jgi:hypothetical protein
VPKPLLVLATLLGSLLLVTGAWMLVGGGAVGEVPAARDVRAPVVTTPATPDLPSPAEPEPADPEPVDPEPVVALAPPVGVSIPAIGVDTSTVRVGLEDDGSMEIPEDVRTVGWYELGVAPGEAGSAVLAGHVDSRTQGRGAFFDLRDLDVGDRATVAHEDGTTSDWEVTGRASYPKDEAPLPELFRRGGEPQLVLITCGGAFDAGARSYRDNVVAILAPA